MTLEDAAKVSLKVFKQVMEEKLNHTNVQIACVTADKGYHVYSEEAVKNILDTLT